MPLYLAASGPKSAHDADRHGWSGCAEDSSDPELTDAFARAQRTRAREVARWLPTSEPEDARTAGGQARSHLAAGERAVPPDN